MKIRQINYIYPNGSNYIYESDLSYTTSNSESYILFNSFNQKWIRLDYIGKFICNQLNKYKSMRILKENTLSKFNISEDCFYEDIRGFIEYLIKNNFYTFKNKKNKKELKFNTKKNKDIQNYPLNTIYIRLTNRCNLNCSYCFNKTYRNNNSDNAISNKIIIKRLKEFKYFGGHTVAFTGGEPTLYNEAKIIQLLEESENIGLKNVLLTNGTILGNLNLKKIISYIDTLQISLDSMNNKTLEKLWGTSKYTYENILNTIKKIDFLIGKLNKSINIILTPIVTKININEVPILIDDIKGIIKNANFNWYLNKYQKIGIDKIDELYSLDKSDYSIKMLKIFQKNNNVGRSVQKVYDIFKNITQRKICKYPCKITCFPSFFIITNGDVFPCQALEIENLNLGNIKNNSIHALLNKKKFQDLLQNLNINKIEDCKNCELRYLCSSLCPSKKYKKNKKYGPLPEELNNCKNDLINLMWLETFKK